MNQTLELQIQLTLDESQMTHIISTQVISTSALVTLLPSTAEAVLDWWVGGEGA